ncbi:MAG: 3-hydroxyacyl-CoA dehydrogenase NAD-binding domain-containing protein [Gemmatimonadaceae bacterium]
MRIAKVGVVGAGTMGSGIAALVASAGLPVVLLDVPGEPDRNGVSRGALQRALKAKPAPFMDPARVALITTGNTEDHLRLLADCDWIVEAIIEQAGPKQALYARIEPLRKPTAIVSSNTSGIPMHVLSAGRSAEFRRFFLGTHFFNPPRYLHLLELIPTADTSSEVLATMREFAQRMLGKGVVIAKDVPGFIANRLGIYGMVRTLRLMEQHDLTIDQVDALTGTLIGRPKSATFRTGDMSGIDVLAHVAAGMSTTSGEDLTLPAWVGQLIASGRLGEKSGAGFYKREQKSIFTLDWRTLEYHPQAPAHFPELDFLAALPLAKRLRALFTAGGTGAEFLRDLLLTVSHYAIDKAPLLANEIVSVDRAMEWGYAWEMGPFRQVDAIGVDLLREAVSQRGWSTPPLLAKAQEAFYRDLSSGRRHLTDAGDYAPIEGIPNHIDLALVHMRAGAVGKTDDALLLDLGDGVLLLEFRGKMNTLGAGVLSLLESAEGIIRKEGYAGLVIGNADPRTFSAGADLGAVVRGVADGNWTALEASVHQFQQSVMSLRRVPFPIVVAPFGLTLGGGCEFALHAARIQAHAELYMGLVEVGVGLLPGGGGTKELLFRFTRDLAPYEEADPFEAVKRAFKLITMATTSTSALDARRLGFLRDPDRIAMNRSRLLTDAKARVLNLAPDYVAPAPMTIRALGREALGNLLYGVWAMREAGYITAHEVTIATKVAYVLSGGDGPPRDVTEQDILDLEREAFLALLGTKETQERIAHTLKTGKPLRN